MFVIAGIDPGIKTGYAVLDLDGRLVSCGCVKEASDEALVRIISAAGIPVLIASDTSPPSHFVQKIASRLNVRVCSPRESMSRLEKRRIGAEIGDPHVRDAYAAAVKAYRRFQNRLRQIDADGIGGKEERKRMALTGRRVSDWKDRNIYI